jgi:DnaJ-class molecular chaperone
MFVQPKQRLVAVCTGCGAFGYSTGNVGTRCGKPNGGRRYRGICAATETQDWQPCPKCQGAGRLDGAECHSCWSRGWLYIRRTVSAAANG